LTCIINGIKEYQNELDYQSLTTYPWVFICSKVWCISFYLYKNVFTVQAYFILFFFIYFQHTAGFKRCITGMTQQINEDLQSFRSFCQIISETLLSKQLLVTLPAMEREHLSAETMTVGASVTPSSQSATAPTWIFRPWRKAFCESLNHGLLPTKSLKIQVRDSIQSYFI